MQLNYIFLLIFNYSYSEKGWKPGDVSDNKVIVHGDNFFYRADDSYSIYQELNVADEVSQFTALWRYYVDHHFTSQLNERDFDIA